MYAKTDKIIPKETPPKISIIIPTYNRARIITRTLDSFSKQVDKNFELIVVDDGSTDETNSVLAHYSKNYRGRFLTLRINNGERGRARNAGLQVASGEYINFFDSDDIAYPFHVQRAKAIAQREKYPEWFYLACDVNRNGVSSAMKLNSQSETLNDCLFDGNILGTNGVFLRYDVAHKYPFHESRELSGSEDYELWIRLGLNFPLPYSAHSTSCLIEHNGRSMTTMPASQVLSRIKYLIELLAGNELLTQRSLARARVMSHLHAYIAVHLASQKNYKIIAILHLLKSLYLKPSLAGLRRIAIVLRDTTTKWR